MKKVLQNDVTKEYAEYDPEHWLVLKDSDPNEHNLGRKVDIINSQDEITTYTFIEIDDDIKVESLRCIMLRTT
jgi:hypothetical protein